MANTDTQPKLNPWEAAQIRGFQALVGSLTPRERMLIEAAYVTGANAARADIAERLSHLQPVTVDGAAMRQIMRLVDSADQILEHDGKS